MSKVTVIGAPINVGCDRHGAQLAPDYLRKKGLINVLKAKGHTVVDAGNIVQKEVIEADKYKAHPKIKFLDIVEDNTKQLFDKISQALSDGTLPIVIGGDHSMGLGNVAGVAHHFGDNVGLIWFDAHGDFNTDLTSPSGNAHGMPCSSLMGFGNETLSALVPTKVKPENIFWIGIRDLDKEEERIAKERNLNIYYMQTIKEKGMPYVINDILRKLHEQGIKHIHCSIDVDGIDPSETPGTGTPVVNGVSTDDFRLLLHALFSTKHVSSIGLTEFNPEIDVNDQTAHWCINTMDYVASLLQQFN